MIRVLFAHPDEKLSQIYSRSMQPHFTVDSVQDGLSALRKIKLNTPSLIVSEYQLPVISGIALLRFVRQEPAYSHIPFVFLTNHHDNSEALNFGANDWLDLSLSHPDLLLDRVYHHLRTNKYGVQIYRA